MTIDIDLPLAKQLHIQEGIAQAFLLQIEVTPIITTSMEGTAPTIGCCCRKGTNSCLIVIRNSQDRPALQVPGEFMTFLFGRNHHTLGNTLIVLDSPSKIDTSHGLDENLQFLALLNRWELDTLLIAHPVNLTDVFPIEENLGKVVTIIQGQH